MSEIEEWKDEKNAWKVFFSSFFYFDFEPDFALEFEFGFELIFGDEGKRGGDYDTPLVVQCPTLKVAQTLGTHGLNA